MYSEIKGTKKKNRKHFLSVKDLKACAFHCGSQNTHRYPCPPSLTRLTLPSPEREPEREQRSRRRLLACSSVQRRPRCPRTPPALLPSGLALPPQHTHPQSSLHVLEAGGLTWHFRAPGKGSCQKSSLSPAFPRLGGVWERRRRGDRLPPAPAPSRSSIWFSMVLTCLAAGSRQRGGCPPRPE